MLCMTRPPTVLVLVVVAVLLACGVPAASAAGGGGGRRMCGHAALMQRRKATAAAEPVSQLVRPAAQPVGTPAASGISYEATYDNIRIGFFTKDLEDASRYCAAEGQVVKDLVRGGDYTPGRGRADGVEAPDPAGPAAARRDHAAPGAPECSGSSGS
eukprot:gene12283-biopygen8588